MISSYIQELTGEIRDRKQVSSHLQVLKGFGFQIDEVFTQLVRQIFDAASDLQYINMSDQAQFRQLLGRIQNAASLLARGCQKGSSGASVPLRPALLSNSPSLPAPIFRELSVIASNPDKNISFRPTQPLPKKFLALTLVNHQLSGEFLIFLDSRCIIDFADDIEAIHSFCAHISRGACLSVRTIRLEFIDSRTLYDSLLWTILSAYLNTKLPRLQTVFLKLTPRDPMPSRPKSEEYVYIPQAEHWGT
ncbi:hypothetical protein MMC28_010831 [Mycoblastus sanguinarius]|nr:hypothetical protein [Mycoblastus sanguinarius]